MDKIIYSALAALTFTSLLSFGQNEAKAEAQDDFYMRESILLPKDEVMEMGSIALMPDKQLAVATRRGEIWICKGAYADDVSKVEWKKIYDAAHEPLGMYYKDGWLYFTDRDAFGRITDKDGDGRYETYEVVNNKWGINGDYHEYAFGSTPDKDGNTYIVLCLTGSGSAKSQWRGWCKKIAPDGTSTPFSSGIRSPGGIGYDAEGNVYYTDNQGLWNGSSCLKPLKQGAFTGNPTGNIFYKDAPNMGERPVEPFSGSTILAERKRISQYLPPAVILPHGKVGNSPTAIVPDLTGGKFGPFANQVFIGEQTKSEVQRVSMEVVNGVQQGAVWKMLHGFRAGIVPMRLDEDGTLFVGGTNRGWGSNGGKPFTLERVRWTGKVPFEMLDIKVQPKGFKMTFTKPVDKATATDVANYNCQAWTYIYRSDYGSPEIDKVTPKVTTAVVSEDGRTVTVTLDKMTQGHVHHINYEKLVSATKEKIWTPDVYYTLNEIPEK